MGKTGKAALVEAALRARERAVAPYSRFQVGAALLTRQGRIITGANVESASYGLTCCAERVALFKALTEGKRSLLPSRWWQASRADPCRAAPAGSCSRNTHPGPASG